VKDGNVKGGQRNLVVDSIQVSRRMLLTSLITKCVCVRRKVTNNVDVCRRGWEQPCQLVSNDMLITSSIRKEILEDKLSTRLIQVLGLKIWLRVRLGFGAQCLIESLWTWV